MTINLSRILCYSNMVNNDYCGSFETCDFIGGNKVDGTNMLHQVLDTEKHKKMDDQQCLGIIKSYLESKFGNDIELLAKNIGVPTNGLQGFITGVSGPPPGLFEELEKCAENKTDTVIMGDKVKGDKIIVSGDMTKNYGNISLEEETKRMELEISDLHKILKSKDEVIKALKETIEALKKQ